MITLEELFDVTWDFTEAHIDAREEGTRLLHMFIFAERYRPSIHQWHDIKDGKLSVILGKINVHGDTVRGGQSEMAWGYKKKSIPDQLMKARVTHLSMTNGWNVNDGRVIYIDVELDKMTVEVLKHTLADKALKWEDDHDHN